MKKNTLSKLAFLTFMLYILPHIVDAQTSKETSKLIADSKSAKSKFIDSDPSMAELFDKSYAYAIFPKIGKGGLIVGGSGGDGIVYHKGKAIGSVKTGQVTVGAQIGGESYREVIFFENKDALDHLKNNKFEFSSQISAVAVNSGVSKNAKYAEGVAIFTQNLSGLMAEVSVGGQKFEFKAFKN